LLQEESENDSEGVSEKIFEVDLEISDDRFANIYNQEEFADSVFYLVSTGKVIYVSKAIIAAQSPLMKNLFHVDNLIRSVDPYSENNFGDKHVVEIDSDEDAFEAMVCYMYTGRLKCMYTDLFPLLKLSRQFRVDRLNYHCVQFLSREIDIDNCLDVYLFCETEHSNHEVLELDVKLKKKCLSFMTRNFKEFIETERFAQICTIGVLTMLLNMDVLKVHDESVVLQSIVTWINGNLDHRLQYVDELLSLVRLDHVSTEHLHTFLIENSWLNEHHQFAKRVNFSLFHKLFRLMKTEPPQLVDSFSVDKSEMPSILTTHRSETPRAISNDPKDDIEVFRGTVDLKSGWIQVNKKRDAIDVTVRNKSVHLIGIGVNSGMKPGQHVASIQVMDGNDILLDQQFEWNGADKESQAGYRKLMFRESPIYLSVGKTVSISVLMKGPFTTQTNNGQSTVVVNNDTDDILFEFSNSSKDANNTSVQKGQIPCLYIQ